VRKFIWISALLAIFGLTSCMPYANHSTQKEVTCGHLEICHDQHVHSNSRHHNDRHQTSSQDLSD